MIYNCHSNNLWTPVDAAHKFNKKFIKWFHDEHITGLYRKIGMIGLESDTKTTPKIYIQLDYTIFNCPPYN